MEAAAPARRADPLSWAVFVVLAVVYRWGRCPSFGPGDSAAVVYRAMFSPNSDPLVLLARAASSLPFDAPEGWINALSGVFNAGASALLFGLLRRLGLKRVPALTAVALLAFSRRYWYYALIAGHAAAATFGLALAVWGVVAWKDEAKPWPLALAACGALGAAFTAPLAAPSPLLCWGLALLAALALQRLSAASPRGAAAILAAALVVPIVRPYDLRRHNPTLEWAQEIVSAIPDTNSIAIDDAGLRAALQYAAAKAGKSNPVRPLGNQGSGDAWRDPLFAGNDGEFAPNGLLYAPVRAPLTEAEMAWRADKVLALSALTSMGRRDMKKYGFTGEGVLYDRYRALLRRYRELLGPKHANLRARLDAQLAEYGPGPAPKP